MTTPWAIVVGACIIGLAIFGARLFAPYQISAGPPNAWKLNTITGEMTHCALANDAGRVSTKCY
jgi:hypothetical protein